MSQIKYRFGVGTRQNVELDKGFYREPSGLINTSSYATMASGFITNYKDKLLCVNIPKGAEHREHPAYHTSVVFYNNTKFLGFWHLEASNFIVEVPKNATAYSVSYVSDSAEAAYNELEEYGVYLLDIAQPHYSGVKKQYKKENNQQFLRASLNGDIELYGCDYQLVSNADIDSLFLFVIEKLSASAKWEEYYKGKFTKVDCAFDFIKQMCKIKLTTLDRYAKILDKYKNTYDLYKTPPAIEPISITKRPCIQVYVKDGDSITNYLGGTYWETKLDGPVGDMATRQFGYMRTVEELHFKLGTLQEALGIYTSKDNGVFSGPNEYVLTIDKNTGGKLVRVYGPYDGDARGPLLYESFEYGDDLRSRDRLYMFAIGDSTSTRWLLKRVDSNTYHLGWQEDGSHIFIWNADAGAYINNKRDYLEFNENIASNAYFINLCKEGNSQVIYRSEHYRLYNSASEERLLSHFGQFVMFSIADIYDTLRCDYLFDYSCWARILCDILHVVDPATGRTEKTVEIASNDGTIPGGATYKRAVSMAAGSAGPEILKSLHLFTGRATSVEPTKFGIDDNQLYFTDKIGVPPTIKRILPVCRSTWANASLWFAPGELWHIEESRLYYNYDLRDSFSIASVIKALLKEIDPLIKHEATEEYSKFLYADKNPLPGVITRFYVYLTQKTNILKGEYDQAAQKAEITFEQLMNMLRDYFKCYWYIENDKFKIEHISFFLGSHDYEGIVKPQLDFTTTKNKCGCAPFEIRNSVFGFDKSELVARYEFNGMDSQTELFGNISVDITANYVEQDKVESIVSDKFSSDIDFMLLSPASFSNDGFALLCPIKDSTLLRLPILYLENLIDENNNVFDATVQNWFASFGYLTGLYTYDLPAANAKSSLIGPIYANGIKRCQKYSISFFYPDDLDLYRPITTGFGDGVISDISVDLTTRQTDVTLLYPPR